MARRSRATGVGKGNGLGSRKGQFKDGMPSANPLGRPKKEKEHAPASVGEAIERAFRTKVEVTENGKAKGLVPRGVAMVDMLMASYPRASVNEKLRILTWCLAAAPEAFVRKAFEPRSDVVEEVLLQLQAEYDARHGIVRPADSDDSGPRR